MSSKLLEVGTVDASIPICKTWKAGCLAISSKSTERSPQTLLSVHLVGDNAMVFIQILQVGACPTGHQRVERR